MSDKTGGAAFPGFAYTNSYGCAKINEKGDWENYEQGMTLLDHFAGLAMQGLLARRGGYTDDDTAPDTDGFRQDVPTTEITAEYAYNQAEAMIAERARRMKKDET